MKPISYLSKPNIISLSGRRSKKKKRSRTMGTVIKHIIVVGGSIFVVALFVVVRHCIFQASTHDGNVSQVYIPYSLRDNNNRLTDDNIGAAMTSNSEYLMLLSSIGVIQIKPYNQPSSSSSSIQSSTSFQRILRLLREGRPCRKCQFYGINVKNQQIFGTIMMTDEEAMLPEDSIVNANSHSWERGMVSWVIPTEEKQNKEGSRTPVNNGPDFVINVGGSSKVSSGRTDQVERRAETGQQALQYTAWGIVEDDSSLEVISNQLVGSNLRQGKDAQGSTLIQMLREPINFEIMII